MLRQPILVTAAILAALGLGLLFVLGRGACTEADKPAPAPQSRPSPGAPH